MRYSKPLYGILGLYIPVSVLLLWAPLPDMVLRFFAAEHFPVVPFNFKLWCAAGILSGVFASCYAGIMRKSVQGHRAADFRGSVIAAAAAYLLLSLLRPNLPLSARFLPSADPIISSLTAVFVWFSVLSIREIFGGLELFESFTDQHQGEKLREAMREFSPEMSQIDRNLKRLSISYALQFIPPCAFLIAASSRVPLSMTLFTLAAFCAGVLLLGFIGLLRRELASASEGLSFTARDSSLPLPVMAAGTAAAAIIAIASSSDLSLLPPGIILVFFVWLGRLIASLFPHKEAAELPLMPQEPLVIQDNFAISLPMDEAAGPWPGWKYVKLFFVALAAFLFLYFMIYPLLKRSGFSLKIKNITAALFRWLHDLRKNLSFFFSALGDHGTSLKMKKIDGEKLRGIAAELSSGITRKETKRSVNLFARLILWGIETAGVPWKASLAPGEYCALLSAAIKNGETQPAGAETSGFVIRCGELFEKVLYSARPLSADEEREFKRMVQTITG